MVGLWKGEDKQPGRKTQREGRAEAVLHHCAGCKLNLLRAHNATTRAAKAPVYSWYGTKPNFTCRSMTSCDSA